MKRVAYILFLSCLFGVTTATAQEMTREERIKALERLQAEDIEWEKNKLNFYPDPDRTIARPTARTMAHYVTVTGSDAEWLRISSWGNPYYIHKAEYCDYVDKYSSHILSNMLYIEEV